MERRELLKNGSLLAGAGLFGMDARARNVEGKNPTQVLKGTFKHSVSRWCYNDIDFEDLCIAVKNMGMQSIELTGPEEWKILKKHGLTSAIGWDTYPEGVSLDNFYTNPDNHDALEVYFTNLIPQAVEAGIDNLICLSGQRQGRTDYQNLVNCKKGIRRIIKMAEDNNITISMELLNSRVDHPDHQFDTMEWGVALCEMIGSPNFKILYDIYHAQIMEGDIVATIRKYSDYISHYHTAGVPGRHEIDQTQELNYRYIMEQIKSTGYDGYIGQEFIPTGETKELRLEALREAVEICDV